MQEERELRRRAAKYTLPYFGVLRARMVLLAAEGLSNDRIAARLDTRREIVSLWRKRFFEDRLAGLDLGGSARSHPKDIAMLPVLRQVPTILTELRP